MNTQITFLRHAKTNLNAKEIFSGRNDCSISEEGRLLAEKLAKQSPFKDGFDAIYVSPLKRTQQTLEAIYPNAKPIVSSDIIEICLGDWEGKLKTSVDQELRKSFLKGEYMPPGSLDISHKLVEERLKNFIDICRNSNHTNILAITHNGVLRTLKRMYNLDSNKVPNLGYICLEFTD